LGSGVHEKLRHLEVAVQHAAQMQMRHAGGDAARSHEHEACWGDLALVTVRVGVEVRVVVRVGVEVRVGVGVGVGVRVRVRGWSWVRG